MICNYGPASQVAQDEIWFKLDEAEKDIDSLNLRVNEFSATVDGFDATIADITQRSEMTETRMFEIEGSVDGLETRVTEEIDGVHEKYSSLEQTVDGFDVRIESAASVAGETQAQYTEIKATLDGLTITDSANGTTKIKGSCIDTGSMNLSGSITFSQIGGTVSYDQLDGSTQTTIDTALNDASDAKDLAEQANTNAANGDWAYDKLRALINGTTTTKIDASCIEVPQLYAADIHLGGNLTVYTSQYGGTSCGYLGGTASLKDGTPGVHFMSENQNYELAVTDNGARFMQNSSNQVVLSNNVFTIQVNGVKYIFTGNSTTPGCYVDLNTLASGSAYLGLSNSRWKNVYTTDLNASGSVQSKNGICTTSDENLKNSIEDLPEKYVNMFDDLTVRRYKMNEGESGRYHIGFVAQEVEEAMTNAGIDSQEFGGFVIDRYEDENGNEQEKYMLRYDEFIGILTAKIKQLEARVKQLEGK